MDEVSGVQSYNCWGGDAPAPAESMPPSAGAVRHEACQLDPLTVRRSTMRRQQRLQVLIGELAARGMDAADVAALLACSPTAARNYLNELLEASVIEFRRAARSADTGQRSGYFLTGDAALVSSFLADLDALHSRAVRLKRGSKPATEARSFGTRHFHIIADDRFLGVSAIEVAVRRDPLVAALFGKESSPAVPTLKEH
jgi:hypothetical protein